MALTPGTRLGVYEVTAQIGEGGMGQVYRARDTKLNRDVALKVLPDSFANDPDRLARFTREAQTLASLNHPNIAHIHGLEESGGVRALVMELVEGDDLSQRIAGGAIPIDEALPIAKQIAEALEAAHEQGIIHRDLKPANIKVRADGTVKVLDFGLAKAMEPPAGASVSNSMAPTITTPAMMTGVGMILGTAAYMSPEQAKGRPADKRTDIWAFGRVLYEMLTARRAFEGDDVSDTMASVLKSEPDWGALPADTPAPMRLLIQRCLVKERSRRVGDIAVAQFMLGEQAALSGPASSSAAYGGPVATSRSAAQFTSMVAAVLITAAVVGGAAWSFRPAPVPAGPVARFTVDSPDGTALNRDTRQTVWVSADGTRLLFKAANRLYLRAVGEVDATEIQGVPPDLGPNAPVFSPDGGWVAFQTNRDNTLKKVSLLGGQALTIAQGIENPWGMSWGTDGIVFSKGAGGVFRVAANGGTPEQIATVGPDEVAYGPQMLPGGDALMFTLAKGTDRGRWDSADIVVQSIRSGERRTVLTGGSDARYVPTGHLLYAVAGTVYAIGFDVERQAVTGEAVPVVTGVRRSLGAPANQLGMAEFSVSDNGVLVYSPGPLIPPALTGLSRVATLIDRSGKREALATEARPFVRPRVSPDAARVVVGVEEGEAADVWIYDLSGRSAARRLTFGGRNRYPVWSADGRRVVFQSDRDGAPALYVQAADGGGAAERLTQPESGAAHVPESWSPDGQTLLFSELRGAIYSLVMWSERDKHAAPFGGVQSAEPPEAVFSPDGRWVAYNFSKLAGGVVSPDRGIFVQPFPATGAIYQVPKVRLDFHPAWGPAGRELFYVPTTTADDLVGVTVQSSPTLSFGTPRSLTGVTEPGFVSTTRRGYDVLPDGRFLSLLAPTTPDTPTEQQQIRVVLNWFEELKRLVPTK